MEQEKRFYIPINNNNELMSIVTNGTVNTSVELYNAVEDITNNVVAELGEYIESIVLRGSLAYGGFINKISDLDLVVFLLDGAPEYVSVLEKMAGRASEKYRHLFSMVDISGVSFDEVCDKKNTRLYLNLKLTGKTLYGKDLIVKLPPCFCNTELMTNLYRQTINDCVESLKMIDATHDIYYMGEYRGCDFLCVWFMRNLIRGFSVPLFLKKKIFTMHLTTCCYELKQLFPQHGKLIEKLWISERYPIQDWNELSLLCQEALDLFQYLCMEIRE